MSHRPCTLCLRSEPEVTFDRWQHRCVECRATRSKHVPRCGVCRKRDHETVNCPLRRDHAAASICRVCGSLPHRVPGLRCRRCGLRRGSQPPLHAVDFAQPHPENVIYPATLPKQFAERRYSVSRRKAVGQ